MKMWNASRTRRRKVLDEGPVSPGAEEGYRSGRTGYLQLVVYYNTLAISVRNTTVIWPPSCLSFAPLAYMGFLSFLPKHIHATEP